MIETDRTDSPGTAQMGAHAHYDPTRFYAHSANGHGAWHLLATHLQSVAALARSFGANAAWASEAALAGLLHDLGKYAERFQARLQGKESGLDHWSQGASVALTKYKAVAAALAIQGHHIGLQRGGNGALRELLPPHLATAIAAGLVLSDPDIERLLLRAHQDALTPQQPAHCAVTSTARAVAAMVDIRLLFSCLVDADFLDTEAHFNANAQSKQLREPGPMLDCDAALEALNAYMAKQVRQSNLASSSVLSAREALWGAVGQAALAETGAFTLTAPTGSGKTLAMLRFALEHAKRNGLKRIVLAVPFLTVIEQTARIYREVFAGFPGNFVLEHHSLAGLGEEAQRQDAEGGQERQRRLLAENWDAPIVLTTNVQLLESMFSNRPSACRKLHRLMQSVILFDEAQSLPQALAVPTLAALSHLSHGYRSSVVFATATQPAFDTLHDEVVKYAEAGWRPKEIVPGHPELFNTLKRVQVRWPARGEKTSWLALAAVIADTPQALVVCNLKRHALALLSELAQAEGVFHLSTNLCAAHRRAVLDGVRKRLKNGHPCRLISTQCVEAGVDVDFPVVYRAFAPLDAVAQAAGRCNREGRLNAQGRLGEVIVFEPEEESDWRRCYPTHTYYQAAEATRSMLVQHGHLDINDPAVFSAYYRKLYDLNDPASQSPELSRAIAELDFVEIAKCYRLIDQNTFQLLVPWSSRFSDFEDLRSEAQREGISAHWMRRAQMLAVSVYRPRGAMPAWAIAAKLKRFSAASSGVSDEWFILEGDHYDNTFGFNPPEGPQLFIA